MWKKFITPLTLAVVALTTSLASDAAAQHVPARLPDPDGKPGSATKPVKVYILAGQSNMVGMGTVRGARCRYSGIYLTPDHAAPKGPMWVGGWRSVGPLRIHASEDGEAVGRTTASVYAGAYAADTNYDEATPVRTETLALGVVGESLPSIERPHTVIVRGFIAVPESGIYTINPGFGDSTCNVTELNGTEIYRKDPGGAPVRQPVTLQAGKRYGIEITYFKGGSAALWLSQENLEGKGDLEAMTRRKGAFSNLVDDEGEWTVRNDVYYQDARINFKGSPLSPSSNGKTFGPELGFGHVLGTYHDEQVLLIKSAMGNRSLAFDFRPPSSGRTDPNSKWESLEYRLMVEGVRKVLTDLGKHLPGYKGQGYEIAGFAWWQGHKDGGSPETVAEYESNLVNLIRDVRKEFAAPKLPVVIATVGFGGHGMQDKYLKILEAQMAVGDPKKHPELAGTVASVDTRGFWRDTDESPKEEGHHYNRNAETYALVGDALGRAMVRLLGGRAEPIPGSSRPAPTTAPASEDTPPPDPTAGKAALAPILIDGMVPAYVGDARNRAALSSEARAERPKRASQFLRGKMFGLTELYRAAGVHDYDWRVFGPDLENGEWEYFTFDPKESLPVEKGNRYRKVTPPAGMEDWYALDFDAMKAGWRRGRSPFGQLGGELAPLSETCKSTFCLCGQEPRTLWEREVLLVRKTIEIPPLRDGHRYRLVVGGSAHVNAGEGFAIYVNGKLFAESRAGVGKRQGGQPRGGHVYEDSRGAFQGGKVTIAAISFLRYNHPRHGVRPPRGHFSLWLEEMKVPPLE